MRNAYGIAHDLGTFITRLHLRAHEIEEDATRSRKPLLPPPVEAQELRVDRDLRT